MRKKERKKVERVEKKEEEEEEEEEKEEESEGEATKCKRIQIMESAQIEQKLRIRRKYRCSKVTAICVRVSIC